MISTLSKQVSEWRIQHGRRVTIHAPLNAYAADAAARMAQEADRVVLELQKLLKPDPQRAAKPIDLYLIDHSSAGPGRINANLEGGAESLPPDAGDSILQFVDSQTPADPDVRQLTERLVARWFGRDAVAACLMVEGIAGLVAAQARLGPPVVEADRWVQDQLQSGRPVSILARLTGSNADANVSEPLDSESRAQTPYDPAATSFVAFLVESFGAPALRTYLETRSPENHDAAAKSAYERPLGVLEENWLNSLQPPRGKTDAFRALLQRLLPRLRPYRSRQLEILVYLALAAACNVATPLVVKYFLKDFQAFLKQSHPTPGDAVFYFNSVVLRFVGALVCIYALSALVSLRRADAVNRLNQRVLNSLQLEIFAHLQRLPHSFYSHAKMGDLMTTLTGDLDNVQSALSQLTNKSLYQIFLLVGGGIGLFLTTGFSVLTLLILLIVPLFALAYTGLRARNKAASREQRRQVGQVATAAQEYLSAYPVIKAFGMEDRTIAAFDTRIQAQRRSKLRLARLDALTDISEDLATALAQLVILGVGGYLMLVHRHAGIHMEDLVASLLLVKYIIGPVASLSGVGQTIQQASGSMDRINELLEEPITIADLPGAKPLPPLSQEIRLERVTFGYHAGHPILHDLSLTIPAGTHAAIVGPTGCGKSTVLNLLVRFWDPDSGRILFDGHDLCDATLASLRDQIGLVLQDTFLFDTTVRDNIAVGRPEATDAEIREAARAARLGGDIEAMPEGYDTVLGERGVRMSGGQRQRLAIARAILRSPRVLILDEPTSALDAQTETGILETLSTLKQGRTVITVTHRLSWAKEADRIFVLDAGRLVEQGSHSELVSGGGLYQKLHEEQMGQVPVLAK